MPRELWRVENWSWKKAVAMLRYSIFLVLLKLCHIWKLIYEIPSACEQSLNFKFWMLHTIQNSIFKIIHIPKFVYVIPKTLNLILLFFFSDTKNMEHLNSATALYSSNSHHILGLISNATRIVKSWESELKKAVAMLRCAIFGVLLKLCHIQKLVYEIPRAFEWSLNIKFWMLHDIQNSIFKIGHVPKFIYGITKTNDFIFLFISVTPEIWSISTRQQLCSAPSLNFSQFSWHY